MHPITRESFLVGTLVSTITSTQTGNIDVTFNRVAPNGKVLSTGVTPDAKTLIFVIDKDKDNAEIIYCTSHSTAAGVTTLVVSKRGLGYTGAEYTTEVAANKHSHVANAEVVCATDHYPQAIIQDVIDGVTATGANNFRVGDGTDSDITLYAQNADANKPFQRYDKTTNAWVFSNDGVSSTPFGTGAGVTGGDGITVTAGDIDVDPTDTTIFKNASAGAGDAGIVPILDVAGRLDSTITGATYTEINQLSGTTNIAEADTFFGATDISGVEAETLTDGSNADSLHVHTGSGSFHAETITKTINATGNFDDTITTNFTAKGILLDVEFIAPGGTTARYANVEMTFDSSSIATLRGLLANDTSTISLTSANYVIKTPTTNLGGSLGSNIWENITITIQSLGSTSFVVRAAATKNGSPANFDIKINVKAWG